MVVNLVRSADGTVLDAVDCCSAITTRRRTHTDRLVRRGHRVMGRPEALHDVIVLL
jgi:hypothetical protein